MPLYATACGKILLSELPEPLLSNLINIMKFSPYTEKTITRPDELLCVLKLVRERGYATDIGESLQNTNCIGVPVRGPSGEIIAALSFSGIIRELSYENELHYYKLLSEASKEITINMFQIYKKSIPKT